jgi:hypothetical protein
MSQPWAGNYERQKHLVRRMMREARKEDPIDIAGAAETILVNLVNNVAPTLDEALKGVELIAEDMRSALRIARGN